MVTYSSTSVFEKGDSYTYYSNKDISSLTNEFEFKDSVGANYRVKIHKRHIRPGSGLSSVLYFIAAIFSPDKYDLFAFAFKEDKLLFWGNIDDFKRCDDNEINILGKEISFYLINN